MPPILHHLLKENPVVITGMGAISAAGSSVDALWENALKGVSPAGWREFPWNGRVWRKAVCQIHDLEPLLTPFPRARKWDRAIQLGCVAAAQALRQARVAGSFDSDRIGLVAGTSRGPRTKWIEQLQHKTVFPSDAASSTIASLSGSLTQCFDIQGASFVVSATCASGAAAIILAAQQILLGTADVMLVGAADAPLNPMMIAQLEASGVMGEHTDPARTCRPFDSSRNGLCLGEGAGFLVLESQRSAEARGVKPLAQIAGWGTRTENAGRVSVGTEGHVLRQTMMDALEMAGTTLDAVSYINAHGTGTVMNDAAEAKALSDLFGSEKIPPCSSTKPVTGHCLGATPVLETIFGVAALRDQLLPPTANCDRPAFPLDVIPEARAARVNTVLSNSLGFWGKHASILLRTWN